MKRKVLSVSNNTHSADERLTPRVAEILVLLDVKRRKWASLKSGTKKRELAEQLVALGEEYDMLRRLEDSYQQLRMLRNKLNKVI
jgi:hypothetical protein